VIAVDWSASARPKQGRHAKSAWQLLGAPLVEHDDDEEGWILGA
jgi:hypothetical protein